LRRLTQLSLDLTGEERRVVTEDMTEEELAIFDLLSNPNLRWTLLNARS
jgi:type I restriction enzyme, R subunit